MHNEKDLEYLETWHMLRLPHDTTEAMKGRIFEVP